METKSQLLSFKIWLIIITIEIWFFYANVFAGLVSRVGSSFSLDPTLNTSPKPHLGKVWPCRHPHHTHDPVWSGKSQLPCSQWLKLHGLTSSDLWLMTPCEPASKQTWTTSLYCNQTDMYQLHTLISKRLSYPFAYFDYQGFQHLQGLFYCEVNSRIWNNSSFSATGTYT